MNEQRSNWVRKYLWAPVALAGVLVLVMVRTALGDTQDIVGSQITYQGSLSESGQPVNGTRDMTFRFYTDGLCTNQVGPDIVRDGVVVTEGYFTVFLSVSSAFVDGQGLWLQADVQGTVFDCQAVTAVPYALTLRPGATIRGATSSANGLLELENQGPGQAIRVTSSDGMALYGTTAGGPAIYGYAGAGYGLRGVSSASGSAAVRGDTSTTNTLGGDFYSQASSGVQGATASVQATPVPGNSETYVAGVRGVAESSGYVYGVYGETNAGASGAGVYATNLGGGSQAPDVELGASGTGSGSDDGILASDQFLSSSDLVFLSNDDITFHLDEDQSFEASSFSVLDRFGTTVFSVDDSGNLGTQGTSTAEDGLITGQAPGDGLFVFGAGTFGSSVTSGGSNGVEVRSAEDDGVFVGATGGDGVEIYNAGAHGLYVRSSGQNGVQVEGVGDYGLYIGAGRNYLSGDTGIGVTAPTNRLHVAESVSGAAASSNHVARIDNTSSAGSADVLALRINEDAGTIGTENNYITFHDAAGTSSLGAIQGNGAGSVTYSGAGSDYAEWLPRLNPAEEIEPGDVVGVFGGFVSKRTAGADVVMVASTGPIVSGNDPGDGRRADYVLVAFIGQVDVQLRGAAASGDLLLPSGLADGTAVAIAPSDLKLAQLPQVLGQAWSASDESGGSSVRAVVGLVQPAALLGPLESLASRLSVVEDALGIDGTE